MPKPTENDRKNFEDLSTDEIAQTLFLYLCDKRRLTMDDVAKEVFHDHNDQASQRISAITRIYGFEGRNSGRFSKLGLDYQDIYKLVVKYPNGCDYDGGKTVEAFLKKLAAEKKDSKDIKTTQPVINAIPGRSGSSTRNIGSSGAGSDTEDSFGSVSYGSGEGSSYSGRSYSGRPSNFGFLKFIAVIALFLVCGSLIVSAVRTVAFNMTVIKVGERKTTFGRDLVPEYCIYNHMHYLGILKNETPKGFNFGFDGFSNENTKFLLGFYKKDKVNFEGAGFDGKSLSLGYYKKGVMTKSWGIIADDEQVKLAYIKDGRPTGIGILRSEGTTSIVNYNKDMTVIAVYRDGEWIKPNGKELKLGKDGSYKKMILKDDLNISVKGIDFCLDPENLSYESETFVFQGDSKEFKAEYYSKEEIITYDYYSGVSVSMKIDDGSAVLSNVVTPS